MSHHGGVHVVIELLEQVAAHDGQNEEQDFLPYRTVQDVESFLLAALLGPRLLRHDLSHAYLSGQDAQVVIG